VTATLVSCWVVCACSGHAVPAAEHGHTHCRHATPHHGGIPDRSSGLPMLCAGV
jgi:hypothetical protein